MLSLLERQHNNVGNDPDNIVILRHDFQSDRFSRMKSEIYINREGCAAVVTNNNNTNNNNNPRQQQQQQSNQILVFGGNYTATDVVESCDIMKHNLNQQQQKQKQQWRKLGRRMPMALRGFAAVNLVDNNDNDEKVCLFAGYNRDEGGAQNGCYKYYVKSDTYEIMPSMNTKRFLLASVTIKNKLLFAIGGLDGRNNALDTVEYYDNTITNNNAEWRVLKAKLNKKRWVCCSASVGNVFYVIGGRGENSKNLDSIEMYDTSKENSKFVLLDAKLKNKPFGASTVVIGCYIIIFGGKDEKYNALNSIEIFNTKTQEFVDSSNYAFPKMTIPRAYFSTVLVDCSDDYNHYDTLGMNTNSKKIVVVGGEVRRFLGEDFSKTTEVIDVKTTAIPISKFCFTKSNNDEHDDGKLPPDINQKILSFLIAETETKTIHTNDTIQKKRKVGNG